MLSREKGSFISEFKKTRLRSAVPNQKYKTFWLHVPVHFKVTTLGPTWWYSEPILCLWCWYPSTVLVHV